MRPIIMSTDSIKAILGGRKTQTRRVVTPKTSIVGEGKVDWSKFCWDGSQIYLDTCRHGHTEKHEAPLPFVDGKANKYYPYEHQYLHIPYNWTEDMTIFRIYPRWEVGDRLWVRETWGATGYGRSLPINKEAMTHRLVYGEDTDWQCRHPSIHMPRWASRITLEVTEVRVERLQEIPLVDVKKEGIFEINWYHFGSAIDAFRELWDSLNAKRGYGWETNPWVWVISFVRV